MLSLGLLLSLLVSPGIQFFSEVLPELNILFLKPEFSNFISHFSFRTIASAIILFEVTGQLSHLLPVLLTVLIASSLGNFFTLSVYDELLREKGLPFMPPISMCPFPAFRLSVFPAFQLSGLPPFRFSTFAFLPLSFRLSAVRLSAFPFFCLRSLIPF
jgi:hypothetical protein